MPSLPMSFAYRNPFPTIPRSTFANRPASNALQHEPCSFLSYAKCARKLVRTDSVFAVGGQPHRGEPLFQSNWRILENRSDFDRKLLFWMCVATLPKFRVLQKRNFLATALRTLHAMRPAQGDQKIETVFGIREILDCLKECFRNVRHARNLA